MPAHHHLPRAQPPKPKPLFDPYHVELVADLVELPISHNLIDRMKMLEKLVSAYEVREFAYFTNRDLVVSRNCMLSLWMYLLRNIDQVSVLKYQEVVFRTIRALLMRREFYLMNLGWAKDGTAGPSEEQRADEAKVCRVYRKLLVNTFLYAAEILPECLEDQSKGAAPKAADGGGGAPGAVAATTSSALLRQEAELLSRPAAGGPGDRPAAVRRFCTMVFAFAFLRIPAIQGPVIETLTWRLKNQEQQEEQAECRFFAEQSSSPTPALLLSSSSSGDGNGEKAASVRCRDDRVLGSMDAADASLCAAKASATMPRAKKELDKHRKFVDENPQLFGWSFLALPDDAQKALPEDPSWLYSLGNDGHVFSAFFVQFKRQIMEMVVAEDRKTIPWMSVPGYALFIELYTPLLQNALASSVDQSADSNLKSRRSGGGSGGKKGEAPSLDALDIGSAGTSTLPAQAASDPSSSSSSSSSSSALGRNPQEELEELLQRCGGGPTTATGVPSSRQETRVAPSEYQLGQIVEMGFSRAEAIVALLRTAGEGVECTEGGSGRPAAHGIANAVGSGLQHQKQARHDELNARAKRGGALLVSLERAVEYVLTRNVAMEVAALGGAAMVEHAFDRGRASEAGAPFASSSIGPNASFGTRSGGGPVGGGGRAVVANGAVSHDYSKSTSQEIAVAEDDAPDLIDLRGFSFSSAPLQSDILQQQQQQQPNGLIGEVNERQPSTEEIVVISKLIELENAKNDAVAAENFFEAGRLKEEIAALLDAESRRLEAQEHEQRMSREAAAMAEAEALRTDQLKREEALLFGKPLDDEKTTAGARVDGGNVDTMTGGGSEVDRMQDGANVESKKGGLNTIDRSSIATTQTPTATTNTTVVTTAATTGSRRTRRGEVWFARLRAVSRPTFKLSPEIQSAVVVGSGVMLGNPRLLALHAFALLGAAQRFSDERIAGACPFLFEVLARWFHQSSTRQLSYLGNIQVKIWVLPLSEAEMDVFLGEFEQVLRAALRFDDAIAAENAANNAVKPATVFHRRPRESASTKALKAIITFLYHNVDLIHGAPRHRLVKTLLKVGFLRLFLNPSDEVRFGFHRLVVYKLLRFHRHHAGCTSDLDLLTDVGARALGLDQSNVMSVLREVSKRKTNAANPWKDESVWVEDLDIDRALQSQTKAMINIIRAAEAQCNTANTKMNSSTGGEIEPKKPEAASRLEVPEDVLIDMSEFFPSDNESEVASVEGEAEKTAEQLAKEEQDEKERAAMNSVPEAAYERIAPSIANYVRQLWDYYSAGLQQKNDVALSIFAPPIDFHKARAAFAPPPTIFTANHFRFAATGMVSKTMPQPPPQSTSFSRSSSSGNGKISTQSLSNSTPWGGFSEVNASTMARQRQQEMFDRARNMARAATAHQSAQQQQLEDARRFHSQEQNARSRPDTTGNDGSGAYWRNANKRDDGSDGRAYGFGNG